MKAEELRICNLVQDDNGKVRRISAYTLYTYKANNDSWYAQTNPIPLTEEWLVKFGFEEHSEGKYSINKKFVMYVPEMIHYLTYTKLKYVHQLQNLYFAITNKELTL